MIIKTDQFELEISKDSDVYLGSKKGGQTFLKWADIDDQVKHGLDSIMQQVEMLMKDSEELLYAK